MRKTCRAFTLRSAALVACLAPVCPASPPLQGAPPHETVTRGGDPQWAPHIEPASSEPQLVMKGFKLPDGFTIDCWAAEPDVAQPVCFWFARDGACYVAETFRHHAGVTDIRDHMDWLDDDVAARSVEDRVAMYRKHLGEKFGTYETEHERVRLLRDKDGDGHADKSTVFADGFHFAADGIGAGLLERDGDVFYTCIPDLWKLRDTDGDDRADAREKISSGWGIRVALLGHDMHGLQIGPDGKLYWSIGDRGFRVTTKEGRVLDNPLTGAVLRSKLDGTQLEVFATGLRNPQELCFDDFGNLWTGDNNSDGGDQARFVHVIEAGETGWRQAYQWLESPHQRGPWNDERLWRPHFDGQAAYVVPPIANLINGPSGLCVNPGTGMSAQWKGHFFLCDFTGASESSGVVTFTLAPKSSSYELVAPHRFVWGPLATDCDFGPGGGLYVSDWVAGWNKTGKGRIWHVFESDVLKDPLVVETQKLLREGMRSRPVTELSKLLAHADRRVRQEAHLELGARGAEGARELERVAADRSMALLARLHATWGLEVAYASAAEKTAAALVTLLSDPNEEVRAQSARVCGNLRLASALDPLIHMLRDPIPRVRLFAAIGCARIGREKAFDPLVALARSTGEHDPHLRHAAIYGMWSCATPQRISELVTDPSADARVAAVVALRRMYSPLVVRFLDDASWRVRAEAARAIHDQSIPETLEALAAQIGRPELASMDVRVPVGTEPNAFQAGNGFVRRVLSANFRLGGHERAAALAKFAADPAMSTSARRDSLDFLAQWKSPPGRDPFTGEWMPLEPRDGAPITAAVIALEKELRDDAPPDVLRAWIRLAAEQRVVDVGARIVALAQKKELDAGVRARALQALGEIKPTGAVDALKVTLFDAEPRVRAAALSAFLAIDPEQALPLLEGALTASIPERRVAYQGLARIPGAHVDEILARDLAALDEGKIPPEIALDVVLAAEKRDAEPVKALLAKRDEARKVDPPLAKYLDSLAGGDAAKGREIFRGKSQLECLRCHVAEGEGGVVGPDLKDVKKRLTRKGLLESIADPNRVFAAGFQGTVVFPLDGPPVEGVVIEDSPARIVLRKADGSTVDVQRADIDVIKPGLSSMPANLSDHLSREEMRDLIEFLTTL